MLEPATPLLWNWHIDAICDHVQAVLEGPELAKEAGREWAQNLLINVPPGTMKSLIVSVFAPAWVWLWKPSWRALFASANPRVSLRDSVRCRDLVESDWYKSTFDVRWSLAEDQNAKGNYKNTAGGFRLAISIGSKVTGDRADAIFVDDPLDAAEAPSKVARDSCNFWWDHALANRLANLITGTRILIMQRLHEDDLAGHLLESGQFRALVLPMEYEPKGSGATATFLGWLDPRTYEGELLMPERFPVGVLKDERKRLGSAGYAGQMQQRPVPEAGEKFLREWWRFWSADGKQHARPRGCTQAPPRVMNPALMKFDEIVGSWDCSFKDAESSDPVVGIVVARKGADKYVLARYRERAGFTATKAAIKQQRKDWPRMWEILIEDKANGTAVIETLASEVSGIVAVEPKGGKEARAAAAEPQVEAGNIYLPEGADWLEEWIDEFTAFPRGKHDDQVDALSQAIVKMAEDSDVVNSRRLLGR